MYRLLLLLSCILLLGACFAHKRMVKKPAAETTTEEQPQTERRERHAARREPKPRKRSPFEYGTPRPDVLDAIKDRGELVVAEFNYPEGHLVAYQYTRYGKPASKDAYYLYFMNDTLIRKSEPEPLEEGAKRAIKEYYHGGRNRSRR